MGKSKKSKPRASGKPAKTPPATKTPDNPTEAQPEIIVIVVKTHVDYKGGHPHVILDDIDDKHVSVGFTTKKNKGKGSTNYTLEIDPLDTGKNSYMRRQGTVAPKKDYTNPRQGKMTLKDHERATEYGDKAKKKYLDNKTKKK